MAKTEEKFKPYKNQDFYKLREKCWRKKKLFEDPEFSPEEVSEWKRPKELQANPIFFGKRAPRFQISQGNLGDCWFLASMSSLASQKSLLHRVVPLDQGFGKGDHYAGIFHFRFWRFGEWVDVVVDDRLPNEDGNLWSAQLVSGGGFWCALVEKAYAKLYGSYEALDGGHTIAALEDFTGGLGETYAVTYLDVTFYKVILRAYHRGSLMCAAVLEENEKHLPDGHAYSITKVHPLDKTTWLIRVRNPWGNEVEWADDWAEGSEKWSSLSKAQLEEIGVTIDDDGEFWMHFNDFLMNFGLLTICHMNPLCFEDEGNMCMRRSWDLNDFSGQWVKGISAGGANHNAETFWQNPQYCITLREADDNDDEENSVDTCTLIVELMQKPRKNKKEPLDIGYYIYSLEENHDNKQRLGIDFFELNEPVGETGFSGSRETSKRFELAPGKYCIIPATLRPGIDAQFLLRVFTEKNSLLQENDTNTEISKPNDEAFGFPEEISKPHNKPKPGDRRVTRSADLEVYFKKLAGDNNEINWQQLKDFLDRNVAEEKKISKHICRQMIAAVDINHTGQLGLLEFQTLVTTIRSLKEIFKTFIEDDSKCIHTSQLRKVFSSAGYSVNNHILNHIGQYYATAEGKISWDDFVMSALKLKSFIGLMNDENIENSGISFESIRKFLEEAMFP